MSTPRRDANTTGGIAERFAVRRSPLADVAPGPACLADAQPWGIAVVHATTPQDGAGADVVLPLGPGRWLAVHEQPVRGLRSVVDAHGGPSTAEDVSHGMTRIRLSGSDSRRLLAAGMTIDLDPSELPAGSSAATAYRDVFVVLHVVDDTTYDVYVLRSFAASLWEWLSDAATTTM